MCSSPSIPWRVLPIGSPGSGPGDRMRLYRFHKFWIGCVLLAYLVLGATFRLTRTNGEVFPFFSWTLFIYVPGDTSEYAVELIEQGGRRFDPPRPLHAARGLVPGAGNVTAQVVVQRMGRAAERGDATALAELRRVFEREHLAAHRAPVHYRLVREHYDPIERWTTGGVRAVSELAQWSAGEGAS